MEIPDLLGSGGWGGAQASRGAAVANPEQLASAARYQARRGGSSRLGPRCGSPRVPPGRARR